ncbi:MULTISPECIES: hypothetical protein [unclassified Bradyrhizobium]|uniref:hypothetical protein n=1 Tax=unclassified Bradyrhizobium TaxID=2631580 RepID=UPI001BA78810|nr:MULTISPECIES: hypothetical protein [unclassified Bradyrhizobium]MBR1206049.1 hypothetical protein [Bradyrhizobium sp. AUGA SZCCT0124]MBR1358803.1 hypothetical protein [Bradyrhizobium sp. AUGA SZCCT0045]
MTLPFALAGVRRPAFSLPRHFLSTALLSRDDHVSEGYPLKESSAGLTAAQQTGTAVFTREFHAEVTRC